jgi:phage replication-related protein YjqB (UPF0714/DUF867 family)
MYEKPQLISRPDVYVIGIVPSMAASLVEKLGEAGFEPCLLEETLGAVDLNTNNGREEFCQIELPSSTDKIALRKFLREWTA